MRNRFRIVIAILFLVLVGAALAWKASIPPEPVYEGKTLSLWLAEQHETAYGLVTEEKQKHLQKANQAIRQIGTNALPDLLRRLREKDSGLKLKLIELTRKQSFLNIRLHSAGTENEIARDGFMALGELASNAVPALIDIFETHPSPNCKSVVAGLFVKIGPTGKQAIPSLLRGLRSTNETVVQICAHTLAKMHAEPKLVVPALINLLSDPRTQVRNEAITSLGMFGADAKEAVPLLCQVLAAPDPVLPKNDRLDVDCYFSTKAYAADALVLIDPEAAAKAGVK